MQRRAITFFQRKSALAVPENGYSTAFTAFEKGEERSEELKYALRMDRKWGGAPSAGVLPIHHKKRKMKEQLLTANF